MNDNYINEAIRMIEEQQEKVKPRSPQWMVGEQLKDICRSEPESAELIYQDLQVETMSITEAEKKIKAFADKNKTGSFACVTPVEAERILREFYGLPDKAAEQSGNIADRKPSAGNLINLMDFL